MTIFLAAGLGWGRDGDYFVLRVTWLQHSHVPILRLRIIVSDINENRNFLQQNLAASLYELAYSLHFFFFLKFWLVEMIGFAPYIEAPDVHKQLVF